MNSATLKSIVLFLLNDVDVKTNENAIELFERWRNDTLLCKRPIGSEMVFRIFKCDEVI